MAFADMKKPARPIYMGGSLEAAELGQRKTSEVVLFFSDLFFFEWLDQQDAIQE